LFQMGGMRDTSHPIVVSPLVDQGHQVIGIHDRLEIRRLWYLDWTKDGVGVPGSSPLETGCIGT
jgi:hypothetical protein